MRKNGFRWLAAGLLFMPCLTLTAQETESEYVSDDAARTTGAVWTEVGVTKVLPYNLSLGLDAGFRTDDWFNEASRFDVGLGLNWKPTKHWKFGIGYTFLFKHYNAETARKNAQELVYKYRAEGARENTNFDAYLGPGQYTTLPNADGTTTRYEYRGYNDVRKDYTRVTNSYWRPKHRLSVDAAYTYKFWRLLRISLRERYQLTLIPSKTVGRLRTGTKTTYRYREPVFEDQFDEEGNLLEDAYGEAVQTLTGYDETPDNWSGVEDNPETEDAQEESEKEKSSKTLHTLRSRLTFEIDKKEWKWTPFAYVELFNNLGEQWHFDKIRASVGVDYAILTRHKLSIGYVFNHENDDDGDQNIHALCVGYKFKF